MAAHPSYPISLCCVPIAVTTNAQLRSSRANAVVAETTPATSRAPAHPNPRSAIDFSASPVPECSRKLAATTPSSFCAAVVKLTLLFFVSQESFLKFEAFRSLAVCESLPHFFPSKCAPGLPTTLTLASDMLPVTPLTACARVSIPTLVKSFSETSSETKQSAHPPGRIAPAIVAASASLSRRRRRLILFSPDSSQAAPSSVNSARFLFRDKTSCSSRRAVSVTMALFPKDTSRTTLCLAHAVANSQTPAYPTSFDLKFKCSKFGEPTVVRLCVFSLSLSPASPTASPTPSSNPASAFAKAPAPLHVIPHPPRFSWVKVQELLLIALAKISHPFPSTTVSSSACVTVCAGGVSCTSLRCTPSLGLSTRFSSFS
mmetsp:Transcript_12982/g.48575  ORF Transcript_12982/g.48575 Transcript_12982/m.48575 type:complete len:373 (-) Transcript_12982:501-1619(-)